MPQLTLSPMEQFPLSKVQLPENSESSKLMAQLIKETLSTRYTISYTDVMEYCPHCLLIDHCFANKETHVPWKNVQSILLA
jgi:hypothetical protein